MRTLGTVSPYRRFPGVLLQPLGQLSTLLEQQEIYSILLLTSNDINNSTIMIFCQENFTFFYNRRQQLFQLPSPIIFYQPKRFFSFSINPSLDRYSIKAPNSVSTRRANTSSPAGTPFSKVFGISKSIS